MNHILKIEGLSKSFQDIEIFSNLSFEVEKGTIMSILGSSGCGKSTLLRIIAGLEEPQAGSIHFSGLKHIKDEAFVIFQEFNQLFPWKTVLQNVMYPMKIRGLYHDDKEREDVAKTYLTMTQYHDSFNKYPHQLSGGMKQKVALARALCLKPSLLLMDEPFASLDSHTRTYMQSLLVDIWKSTGISIIFVTHDIYEALSISDQIAVMGKKNEAIKAVFDIKGDKPRSLAEEEITKLWSKLHSLL